MALLSANSSSHPFELSVVIYFGSNSSQLGYVINKTQQTHIVQDWANNVSVTRSKTNILLSFDGKFIAFGYQASQQYSSKLESDDEESAEDVDDDDDDMQEIVAMTKNMLFKAFKRALYNDKSKDLYNKIQCEDGRFCETSTVLIEALKFMKRKILKYLKFELKNTNIDTNIDTNKIQWILPIPPNWSDIAKYRIKLMAEKAGLISSNIKDHLQFVYETECASITFYLQKHNGINHFRDKYIIIDAGAGITDVGFYEIINNDSIKELYPPITICSGSHNIDDYFQELLFEIFGKNMMNRFKKSYPSNYAKIKNNFYNSKASFYKKQDAPFHAVKLTVTFMNFIAMNNTYDDDADLLQEFYRIVLTAKPFGISDSVSMENYMLNITSSIWRLHLFDKVIDPLIDGIKDILRNKVKGIKHLGICGGLTASKYFQHRIQESFGMKSKYRLSIKIQLKEKILFTIKGALQLALNKNYVAARCARFTYGIAVDRSDKNVDINKLPDGYLDKNSYIHPYTHKRTVRNLFSAFIKKNALIKVDDAVTKQYRRFSKNEKTSKISLYCSDLQDPYIAEGSPFASVIVKFPDNYDELKMSPRFFFGDTKIKITESNLEVHLEYNLPDTNEKNDYYQPQVMKKNVSIEKKEQKTEELKDDVIDVEDEGLVMDTIGGDIKVKVTDIYKQQMKKESVIKDDEYGMVVDTPGNDLVDIKEQETNDNDGGIINVDDKCRLEFERFLVSSIPNGAQKYLGKFKENGYNDIRYVNVLDFEILKDEIGMNGIDRKLFIKCINNYNKDYNKFEQYVDELNMKEKYHKIFENNGIATLWSYYHHIKSVEYVRKIIKDENDSIIIWNKFNTNNTDKQVEGN